MRLIDADMLKKYMVNKNRDTEHFLQYVDEQPTVQIEETKWISVSERLPEDGDCRYYMCLVENHLEDPPMMCQYEEEYGFGFYHDIHDPVSLGFVDTEFQTMEELNYEKVLYWMPMIEPPEEAVQDD